MKITLVLLISTKVAVESLLRNSTAFKLGSEGFDKELKHVG